MSDLNLPKSTKQVAMQYVGRAIGSVSKTWSSINPATLSGAIDVIVVEHPDGELACSPFHVRFGKFQILKPSQKKVEVFVNEQLIDIPMKLGDSGEAYFVFETLADLDDIPEELISSPVVSAASSPESKPGSKESLEEPDFLDINDSKIARPLTPSPIQRITKKLTQKQIPSSVDNNGDLLLDIEGYKTSKDKVENTNELLKQLLHDELGHEVDLSKFVKEDLSGSIRILNPEDSHWSTSPPNSPPVTSAEESIYSEQQSMVGDSSTEGTPSLNTDTEKSKLSSNSGNSAHYIKTIRLTSKQLKCLDLQCGENDLTFSVDKGRAIVTAKLFYWKWNDPIVISDIDGTITKSDALGHVLTMIGKDWTHSGVATLFTEIKRNGYNIMYLTARSAGQAESTRSYLRSIVQDGSQLPVGPVILSPDRTMAALRREVILKKPEVFKIACLNDMRELYFPAVNEKPQNHEQEEMPTPFVAGFGNRITDALSYRTVGIPSSRIFTINPDGEVHMELLELAGYKSSYIHINELVDHFFPPVKKYPLPDDDARSTSTTPGSPFGTSLLAEDKSIYRQNEEKFTDFNYWREPILSIDDLSDISDNAEYDSQRKPSASSNISEPVENDQPVTPTKSSHLESIGERIYLDLGSPLSSPELKGQHTAKLLIDRAENNNSDHLHHLSPRVTNPTLELLPIAAHPPVTKNNTPVISHLQDHTNPYITLPNNHNSIFAQPTNALAKQFVSATSSNQIYDPDQDVSPPNPSLDDIAAGISQPRNEDPNSEAGSNVSEDEYEDEFDEDEDDF